MYLSFFIVSYAKEIEDVQNGSVDERKHEQEKKNCRNKSVNSQ
jgi:hypothetical protein